MADANIANTKTQNRKSCPQPPLRWAELLEPDGFNTNDDSLDEPLLAQFHGQGMTTAVWTVDEEADMRRLAQWGVDAIITNKPDLCLQVLQAEGKR